MFQFAFQSASKFQPYFYLHHGYDIWKRFQAYIYILTLWLQNMASLFLSKAVWKVGPALLAMAVAEYENFKLALISFRVTSLETVKLSKKSKTRIREAFAVVILKHLQGQKDDITIESNVTRCGNGAFKDVFMFDNCNLVLKMMTKEKNEASWPGNAKQEQEQFNLYRHCFIVDDDLLGSSLRGHRSHVTCQRYLFERLPSRRRWGDKQWNCIYNRGWKIVSDRDYKIEINLHDTSLHSAHLACLGGRLHGNGSLDFQVFPSGNCAVGLQTR